MDSLSLERYKQLIVAQVTNMLKENGIDVLLASLDIYDVEDLVGELFEENYVSENIDSVFTKIRYYSFTKLKRRWVRAAIKNFQDNKGPKKELRARYEILKDHFNTFGAEHFYQEFNTRTVLENMNKSIMILEEWAENHNRLIHTYPYWSQKTKNQKTSTLKTDILMIIGEVSKDIKLNQPKAHTSPSTAIDVPFFGVSDRIKNKTELVNHNFDAEKDSLFELYDYDSVVPKYKAGVPSNISILVSKEFIKELNGKVPDLDAKDFEAFNEILSFRDVTFQTSRKIVFPLAKLVSKLYSNDSGKSYELTTKRLMKLGYYRVAGHNNEGDFFIRGLFSSVTVRNSASKLQDSQVIVTVTEEVYDDLLKQQIISIYGEQIEQLKGSFAYHLAFVLQKERMSSIQLKEASPAKRHWGQFTHSIRFNKSRKSENLKELEANLDRIKEHNFIIKDWHRSGDYYFFYFYPLEQWELDDTNNVLLL